MLLDQLYPLLRAYWPFLILASCVLYFLRNKYQSNLHKYPGPALAAYSDWWRFFDVLGRQAQHTHIGLHRRHGDIVRLGPNVLSFASPKAIKDIYGLSKGYTKTQFYPVQNNVSKGERIHSLFSTLDEGYHAQLRRSVNSAFAMSTLVSYEPLVDSTTSVFLKQTQRLFCDDDKICNFSRWLQFYAFDVIGEMSFSKRLGFVEENRDVEGIVDAISRILEYAGPVGQQPWLDRYLLDKNPLKMFLARHGLIRASNPVAAFALSRVAERRRDLDALKEKASSSDPAALEDGTRGVDFLSRFTLAQRAHPDFMTDFRVLTATTSLINAGSDTTAITLSAVFYFLLKHPRCYDKVMAELDTAIADGRVVPKDDLISWADTQKLPYLDAVIQEAFRLHPAVGLLLERHVPPGGAVICGEQIPGGTIVGCNAWVLHRRPEVFGPDVDAFRPERWLDRDPAALKDMKATMFHFGAGARTCIGRNISTLEVYKLVPSLLRRFEIELARPGEEWETMNCWFVRQLHFDVRFKPRALAEAK